MVDLKIRKVVLYKTGLGFFEKKGKIDLKKQKKVKITFQNSTMNDLLKTFSILRISGDLKVASVSYEGKDTNAAKMLQDSIIKLPEKHTLINLLNQLRGFNIQVTIDDEEISGIIVGMQQHEEPVSDKSEGVIEENYILLKDNDSNVSRIKVKKIDEIRILDDVARKDFDFFMEVVQSLKSEKYRNVNIFFDGKKESEFLLTFLQELPAFKVSWRLYLQNPDEIEENSEGDIEIPILLHGWAIIDNVLDEDWEGIRLSLMSGLPISFKYDSYSPLYISRPYVSRTQDLSVKKSPTTTAPSQRVREDKSPEKEEDPLKLVNKIIQNSNVKGSGYKYDIPMPVTVKRNQSSLIPILQKESKATMVSVYNKNVDESQAMSTLEFENDTGMILEEGPISVFLDDVFQGEAMLPFLEKDETQRIPYAVNQAIEINTITKLKNKELSTISLKSQIFSRYYQFKETTYELKNVSDKKQILIIEHPKENDWKLHETEKPIESTDNFHRFKIHLDETDSKKLILNERKLIGQYSNYVILNNAIVDRWYELKLISESEYGHLKKLIEFHEKETKLEENISTLRAEKDEISMEQERIRKNMKVLGKSKVEKNLRDRYVEKFQAGETKIESIEKSISKLQRELELLRNQMSKYKTKHFNDKS